MESGAADRVTAPPTAKATDRAGLSGLPPELVDRLLTFIPDHRTLARLARVSAFFSRRAASRAGLAQAIIARDSTPATGSASSTPIAPVPWKKLFEHQMALDHRWKRGQPVVHELRYPYPNDIVALHPDFVIASSFDGTVRLLKRFSAEEIRVLRGHRLWSLTADVDENGSRVVTGSLDRTVRVWDTATGACKLVLGGLIDDLVARVRLNSKCIIALFGKSAVKAWNRFDGALIQSSEFQPSNVAAIDLSADSFAVLSTDHSLTIWDAVTGHSKKNIAGWNIGGTIGAAALWFEATRVAALCLQEREIYVWDALNGAFGVVAMRLSGNRLSGLRNTSIESIEVQMRTFETPRNYSDGLKIALDARTSIITIWDFGDGIPFSSEF
ncbi:WD40-repeat-containing domain protein [Zopfochytrium polystomum]|nr:WD40-repeat-containing domain protein [Zopfochytrium polystomum]